MTLSIVLLVGPAGCIGGSGDAAPQASNATSNASPEANVSDGEPESNASLPANATPETSPSGEPEPGNDTVPISFAEPVRVNGNDSPAFEPSIEVADDGTVIVTAAGSGPQPWGGNQPTRASPVWYSTDDGASWQPMPSPEGVQESVPGLEGDLALDDEGGAYFVDTYLADSTFTRWTVEEGSPSWELTRPVQGTTAHIDDRPWLAAHGDGIVYAAVNTGFDTGDTVSDDTTDPAFGEPWWFYRSTDQGRTWSLGHSFDDAQWCNLAASEADDRTVFVGCSRDEPAGTIGEDPGRPHQSVVFASSDRGETWDEQVLANWTHDPTFAGREAGPPAITTDAAGQALFVWADEVLDDGEPGQVRLAHQKGDGWTVADLTPFEGSFANVWVAAGETGAAVTFYATNDTEPAEDSVWHAYALATSNVTDEKAEWTLHRLTVEPVAEDDGPPIDFFQATVGPENRVHVAFHRPTEAPGVGGGVYYVRQATGPSLDTG